MNPTRAPDDLGQSVWLDNITRDLLEKGTLERYVEELSVAGLTSNPTIFDHAIRHSSSYDGEIRKLAASGLSNEATFFELALQDLTRGADLFAPIHGRTAGVNGFVSFEVSPLLAHDTAKTVEQAGVLDLTASAFLHDATLERFAGRVSDSGEKRWTVKASIDEDVPSPVLTTALYQRFSSRGEADCAEEDFGVQGRGGFYDRAGTMGPGDPKRQVAWFRAAGSWRKNRLSERCRSSGSSAIE